MQASWPQFSGILLLHTQDSPILCRALEAKQWCPSPVMAPRPIQAWAFAQTAPFIMLPLRLPYSVSLEDSWSYIPQAQDRHPQWLEMTLSSDFTCTTGEGPGPGLKPLASVGGRISPVALVGLHHHPGRVSETRCESQETS